MSDRPKTLRDLGESLYKWVVDRLERTPFLSFKFTIPQQYLSPYGYLGTLTTVTFIVLGISGAFLMFYYRPDVELAWLSVKEIEEEVPFGFIMRNLHYHASNLMVLLAVAHLYYQYFSGRYKIKNEVLWVTGILLGILTVLEAYTGYDLILNQRALLAINIGTGLTFAAPVIGPSVAPILIGGGLFDLIVRFYALHVFIIPMIMLVLMAFHIPRFLVLDIPIVLVLVGGIFVAGGMFPVHLGLRFDPSLPEITVPEWYLTAIYAFIRTGTERFFSGALLPLLFTIMFLIIPFVDKSRKLGWRDRPFFTALGISSIILIIFTTLWGFYVDFSQPTPFEQLYIEPTIFYGSITALTLLGFFITYRFITKPSPPRRPTPAKPFVLSSKGLLVATTVVFALMVLTTLLAFQTYFANMQNVSMFNMGMSLILFGLLLHLYRHGISRVAKQPSTTQQPEVKA
ncbi:MAG: cytochrome b N-terminal domain-containing protein [Aigarchaeota archaeon]|nr:cytochrome b N-terminal domain-containing protein [Aigarchaeota archaeon]MDW8093303.1 cytochrome b N-terminal domain-containing protein [Nitrososphaerota archaeon]